MAEGLVRRRVTIRDIARAAGVSPSAVSFALNGRPGVGEGTRARILATAHSLGWVPNAAARALSAARASAVGLVVARPGDRLSGERFFFDFIMGAQDALHARGYSLLLEVAEDAADEIATYEAWWGQGRVDGVLVLDPVDDDPRPARLRSLELPAVITGEAVPGFASLVTDDTAVMTGIVDHLADLGRTRIGYVCGPSHRTYVRRRAEALASSGARRGVAVLATSSADSTETAGRVETARLLRGPACPDALVFDNEVLALGGLTALRAAHLAVGRDVAVVSCEDSVVCRVVEPPLTAVRRDPSDLGRHAVEMLLDVLDGEEPATRVEPAPRLEVRASSGPAASGGEGASAPAVAPGV